jgi:hypothetical protein
VEQNKVCQLKAQNKEINKQGNRKELPHSINLMLNKIKICMILTEK